jgi:uncharacterized membrane protein YdfJ with MMPL/SSD domain
VLGGFGSAKTISLQEIGIGLAIAIIMDATLIRMLLLPATMRLLGTFNWWAPVPLRWLWQHIGLRETPPTPALSPVFQVQAGWERNGEHLLTPLPLQMPIAFGHETRTSQKHSTKQLSKVLLLPVESKIQAKEDLEQNQYMISRVMLEHYENEIVALLAELESTRADFDRRIDAHRARLLELLHAINPDLQASTSALDSPGTTPRDVTSQHSNP